MVCEAAPMQMMFRDADDQRRYIARAKVAATLRTPTGETLTEEERAKQVLAVLVEAGAISQG
jgi:hypothetical protein